MACVTLQLTILLNLSSTLISTTSSRDAPSFISDGYLVAKHNLKGLMN